MAGSGAIFPHRTLEALFSLQDAAMRSNRTGSLEVFDAIELGLVHGWDANLRLASAELVAKRQAKPANVLQAETIRINLLHAVLCSLVSATRLCLAGAHVDGLTLLRSGLEAAYFAAYFSDHPEAALEWDKVGDLPSLRDRREFIDKFDRKRHVRKQVELTTRTDSISRLYYELST